MKIITKCCLVSLIIGMAGVSTLTGCGKDEDLKTVVRSEHTTKHDTVYVNKTDTLIPDTVHIPGDTLFIPGDTLFIPGDTIYLPGDTIYTPQDTIYISGDTIFTKPDTVYTPSKPDTIYLKPDTVYIEKPDKPHYNITYIWGVEYWDEVWPADNIIASANSALIDTIFLKNDGVSFEGLTTTATFKNIQIIIESVPSTKRHKIRGAGTLNDTSVSTEQNYQDSISLAKMGFKFGHVYH